MQVEFFSLGVLSPSCIQLFFKKKNNNEKKGRQLKVEFFMPGYVINV